MSDAAHLPDDEILARLAARDLAAAERVHDKLMAAEETADIAELGRTYQRLARSVRQTLALKAKLAGERATAAAALSVAGTAPKAPPEPAWSGAVLQTLAPAARARIDRVRGQVMPYIEREAEPADYEGFLEAEVFDILIEMAAEEAFLDTPVEELTARVLDILGLPTSDDAPPPAADPEPPVDDSA